MPAAARTAVLALVLSLAAAPAAHADAFSKIYADYQSDGKIDACEYSVAEIKQAKGQVPTDIETYAPDFPEALDAAAEARAGGACGGDTATAAATTTAAAAPAQTSGTPAPTPAPTPNPALDQQIAAASQSDQGSDAGVPAPVVALLILGGLLAVGGAVYAILHWLAYDPAWARRARHTFAEAGWRASGTWAEFVDWVRLGR